MAVAEPQLLDDYLPQSKVPMGTMGDSIAETLRSAILSGTLSAGTVLRQETLAAKFGVSRVPVREALLKLQIDGLVEVRPRRGTIVTAPDVEAFREILEMRLVLERLALELAVPKATAQDFEAAEQALSEATNCLERARHDEYNAREELDTRWGDLNWRFHRALYAPSRRERLLDTLESLHVQFGRQARLRPEAVVGSKQTLAQPQDADESGEWHTALREHHQLLDACKQRDVATAQRILEEHISQHGNVLLARLERTNPKVSAEAVRRGKELHFG